MSQMSEQQLLKILQDAIRGRDICPALDHTNDRGMMDKKGAILPCGHMFCSQCMEWGSRLAPKDRYCGWCLDRTPLTHRYELAGWVDFVQASPPMTKAEGIGRWDPERSRAGMRSTKMEKNPELTQKSTTARPEIGRRIATIQVISTPAANMTSPLSSNIVGQGQRLGEGGKSAGTSRNASTARNVRSRWGEGNNYGSTARQGTSGATTSTNAARDARSQREGGRPLTLFLDKALLGRLQAPALHATYVTIGDVAAIPALPLHKLLLELLQTRVLQFIASTALILDRTSRERLRARVLRVMCVTIGEEATIVTLLLDMAAPRSDDSKSPLKRWQHDRTF